MAVTYDSSANGNANSTTLSFNHTCAANATLYVGVMTNDPTTVSGVTYNSVAMTAQGTPFNDGGNNFKLSVFKLLNPASGTNSVSVTISSSGTFRAVSVSYTGSDTLSQPNAASTNTANTTTISTTTTSTVDNCLQIGFGISDSTGQTAGANTTQRNTNASNGQTIGVYEKNAVTTPAGASTITFTPSISGGLGFYGMMVQPPQPVSNGNFFLFA